MPHRTPPEWTSGGIAPDVSHGNPWDWSQVEPLLSLLSDIEKTTDSKSLPKLAKALHGDLPSGKNELRLLRENLRGFFLLSRRNEVLKARRGEIWVLLQAVRMKLGSVLCRPNQKSWSKRAYQLMTEIELNLGKIDRVYFATLTFPGNPDYRQARDRVRGVTRNLLYRAGFETLDLIAIHPSEGNPGRLHAHLLIWSGSDRSARAEKESIESVKRALADNAYGVGFSDLDKVESLPTAAGYMAWNFDRTIKLSKGPHNPVPKGARVLSVPRNLSQCRSWSKARKFSFHCPAHAAFRVAVARFASDHRCPEDGNWGWIWRQRRRIREGIGGEPWIPPSVTGMDGFTYSVSAYDLDAAGEEVYLLGCPSRERAFILTEQALEELGMREILPGSLKENPALDPTTGLHACWIDIWLPDFPCGWSKRGKGISTQLHRPPSNPEPERFRCHGRQTRFCPRESNRSRAGPGDWETGTGEIPR